MFRFNREVLLEMYFNLSDFYCIMIWSIGKIQYNLILSWSFPKVKILTVRHAEESRIIARRLTRVDTLVTYAAARTFVGTARAQN